MDDVLNGVCCVLILFPSSFPPCIRPVPVLVSDAVLYKVLFSHSFMHASIHPVSSPVQGAA